MRRFRLPYWVTHRFEWALAAIALLLACSPGVALFAPLAAALAIALVAGTLADALRLPPASALRIERELPPHLSLRRSGEAVYQIENTSARPLLLDLSEAPTRTLVFADDVRDLALAPRSRTQARSALLPRSRGSDRCGRLYATYRSPLGLVRRRAVYEADAAFRVYPDLSAVERYGALHTRNRLIEAGLRSMRLRGVGSEFESVRDYEPGDAFRAIDWKASARRGKLMVTQREVERSQDVLVLIDCGRLMTARVGEQRKLDYAITAGLSLATIASLASDRVGLVAFSRRILAARAPRSTAASVRALADTLCDIEPIFEESDYAQAFAYVRGHLHRRSLVVFFTDVIDPVSQSAVLAELGSLSKRHVVLCVFMNDEAVTSRLAATPRSVDEAYQFDVAEGLAEERKLAARRLEREGIIVIDAPAAKLSIAAIDEYLRVKSRGLL